MSYQKVIIVGNLGKDPEVRYLDTGVCVASFPVATSDSYKNKNGERITSTEWFTCVAWNNLGKIVEQYLHKGSKVLLEMKKRDREYDKDGETKRVTEFTVLSLQMLDPKPQPQQGEVTGFQGPTDTGQAPQVATPQNQPTPQSTQQTFDNQSDNGPDDLPF